MHGKVKHMVELSSVRWLSVETCIRMIFEYYDSLVMSLENGKSSNATAVGIWQFTASTLFLLTAALLIDVLSAIGTRSLLFQKDIANLSVIRHSVTSTVQAFEGMIDGSPVVNRVLADVGDVPGTGKNIYKGFEIADNNNLRAWLNSVWRRYPGQAYQQPTRQVSRKWLGAAEMFWCCLEP